MKVLGFCCGRANGNTEILMKEAFRGIAEVCDAQCELIRLQEAEIRNCTGCESCVMNHLKGDKDFRCVHPRDSDHLYFIEQKMRQADAIILSAPSYNMLPPGILIKILNRLHGTGDYSDVYEKDPKIGAVFTIGGSDWTNYTMPIANLVTNYLTGSFETVVDRFHFDLLPAPSAVLLEDHMLERAHLLGSRVGEALADKAAGRPFRYRGPEGLCPECHGSLLERREDGWYCPQCMNKAALDGDRVTFPPEGRVEGRSTELGHVLHVQKIQGCHKKAAEQRETITERRKSYVEQDVAVRLPALKAEG